MRMEREERVTEAVGRTGALQGVNLQHRLDERLELDVLFAPFISDDLVQGQHVLHVVPTFLLSGRFWPSQATACLLDVHLHLMGCFDFQIVLNLVVFALFSQVVGDRPTLFLNHGQVLQVLVRVEEKLARVEFDENACHRPHVRSFIPFTCLQDDLRSPVLSRVYNGCVALVFECGPSEVNQPDLSVSWPVPRTLPNDLRFLLLIVC